MIKLSGIELLRKLRIYYHASQTHLVRDMSYKSVTDKELKSISRLYYWLSLFLRVGKWKTTHDCDDKARLGMCCSAAVHSNSSDESESLAFGSLGYIRDSDKSGHYINWFLGNDNHFRYWEPQLRKEIELSNNEINSVYEVGV